MPEVSQQTGSTNPAHTRRQPSEFSGRFVVAHGRRDPRPDVFSKGKPALTDSLTRLRTRYGTAVWNSVILASQQLRVRKGSAKAIVILTDGRADTTSTDVGRAINAAKGTGARAFVVIAGPGGTKQRDILRSSRCWSD